MQNPNISGCGTSRLCLCFATFWKLPRFKRLISWILLVFNMNVEAKLKLEPRELGQNQMRQGSLSALGDSEKWKSMFWNVRGWPIAKSFKDSIPILTAMLKHCETFENELPDRFRWKDWCTAKSFSSSCCRILWTAKTVYGTTNTVYGTTSDGCRGGNRYV